MQEKKNEKKIEWLLPRENEVNACHSHGHVNFNFHYLFLLGGVNIFTFTLSQTAEHSRVFFKPIRLTASTATILIKPVKLLDFHSLTVLRLTITIS